MYDVVHVRWKEKKQIIIFGFEFSQNIKKELGQ